MRRRDFISVIGGAMVAMPGAAWAQAAHKIPRVGYLWHAGSAEQEAPYFGALLEGFARIGYVDGRTIKIEHRFPNETPERFKSMAAELVASKVDVLMGGATASPYLRDATTTIPIVFMFVPDPVGMKLVQSLARPGGNITGFSNFGRDTAGKRLQLLKEMVPDLTRVALLVNSNQPTTRGIVEVMQSAGSELGLVLQTFEARSLAEMESAFNEMVRARMQAVMPVQGGIFFQHRASIPKFAIERLLPMSAYSRETFDGALVFYGPDQVEMCRRSAVYADKIIKGANPADLPVEQPTKLGLAINLKTAKALGLTVPQSLLLRADEVIQ